MFRFEVLEKMMVSFTYWRNKIFLVWGDGPIPIIRLLVHANCNNQFSISVTRMNKYGDRGSPYFNPWLVLIHLVGSPFINRAILEEKRMFEIQKHHFMPNPLTLRSSTRRCHSPLSNPFWMSSFRIRSSLFDLRTLCNNLSCCENSITYESPYDKNCLLCRN